MRRDARGSAIPAALNRAHARGVNVRLVADRRAPCDLQEGVSALAAAGIPIWIDARARVAHEKALIIDRRVTIIGSYNWSKGAASNSEDLNVSQRQKSLRRMRDTGRRGRRSPSASLTRRNGAGDNRAGSLRYQRCRRAVSAAGRRSRLAPSVKSSAIFVTEFPLNRFLTGDEDAEHIIFAALDCWR
jgi:hypothetical protein